MLFDEFVAEVQQRAGLRSLSDAVRAIRCTLSILSERLIGFEVRDLASQLPDEIGYYLLHGEAGTRRRFSANEFLERVRFCEGDSKAISDRRARAVLGVMREAMSPARLDRLLDHLSDDYRPLFSPAEKRPVRVRPGAVRLSRTRRQPVGGNAIKSAQESPRSARRAKRATGVYERPRCSVRSEK